MQLADGVSLGWTCAAHLALRLVPLGFISLHFHDHLQIVELLRTSEVVHSVDEGLFSHSHNFLTNVLDDVVFELLVWV